MKRNIVNPDLIEERAKLAFDRVELQKFTLGEWLYDKTKELDGFMAENPELLGSADDYEMTREELIEHYWKKVGGQSLSQEFKDLVLSMFSHDGTKRPTLEQIKNHPWMKKPNFLSCSPI